MPALANVWAMPLPITPAPITPTLMSATVLLLSIGFSFGAPGEQALAQCIGGVAGGVGRNRLGELAQRAPHLGAGSAAQDLHHGEPVERELGAGVLRDRLARAFDRTPQRREAVARECAL